MEQHLFNQLQTNFKTFISQSTQRPIKPPRVFTFNSSHIGRKLSDIAQDIKIKSLIDSGMPEKIIKKSIRGKKWGWEIVVKNIIDYEKTTIFGYGDDAIGYTIVLEDIWGNHIICFVNTFSKMKRGTKYLIDGVVSEYKPQVRINRVKIVHDYQNPEAPPQSVVAM